MKVGDLVKVHYTTQAGKTGIVTKIQSGDYCIGAYVFFDIGIRLVRVENLEVISESR